MALRRYVIILSDGRTIATEPSLAYVYVSDTARQSRVNNRLVMWLYVVPSLIQFNLVDAGSVRCLHGYQSQCKDTYNVPHAMDFCLINCFIQINIVVLQTGIF